MAVDIINSIMDHIVETLPGYVNEGLNVGDPDYLETVEKGPLQDDPTLRATYIVVEADSDADPDGYRQPVGSSRKNKLRHVDTAPMHEIGGGLIMINYFRVGGWTPQSDDKSSAYEEIGKFTRRLERAIQKMARQDFAAGISTDDGMETTGGMLQIFNLNGTTFKLIGGESEWYGKVYIKFAVYSKVENEYWK